MTISRPFAVALLSDLLMLSARCLATNASSTTITIPEMDREWYAK